MYRPGGAERPIVRRRAYDLSCYTLGTVSPSGPRAGARPAQPACRCEKQARGLIRLFRRAGGHQPLVAGAARWAATIRASGRVGEVIGLARPSIRRCCAISPAAPPAPLASSAPRHTMWMSHSYSWNNMAGTSTPYKRPEAAAARRAQEPPQPRRSLRRCPAPKACPRLTPADPADKPVTPDVKVARGESGYAARIAATQDRIKVVRGEPATRRELLAHRTESRSTPPHRLGRPYLRLCLLQALPLRLFDSCNLP